MKKLILSSFLFFSITNAQTSLANPFSDVSPVTLEGGAAITLYHEAIIGGFEDGTFHLEWGVNRAEAMKFLLRARGGFEASYSHNPFADVDENTWYGPYILTANQEGIIQGYADGLMRPGQKVTTAEFLKMMTLTFDLPQNLVYHYDDAFDSDWFGRYSGIAVEYDLFPNRDRLLLPNSELTRGEASVAIYQYLKSQDKINTTQIIEVPLETEETKPQEEIPKESVPVISTPSVRQPAY